MINHDLKTHFQSIHTVLSGAIFTYPIAKELFTVHGQGVGDKAFELATKSEVITKAGFDMLHRHVIGVSLLHKQLEKINAYAVMDRQMDQFVKREFVTEEKRMEIAVYHTPISAEIKRAITDAVKSFENFPVVICRSAGFCDASGTGIYSSIVCSNRLRPVDNLSSKTEDILARYFSKSAVEFRRVNGIEEGFSLIIEPLIGRRCNAQCDFDPGYIREGYAPELSGYGFTNSPLGPYVQVAKGLAEDLVHNPSYGVRVVRENSDDFLGFLEHVHDRFEIPVLPKSFMGKASFFLLDSSFHTNRGVIEDPVAISNLSPLFERMQKLEEYCGKPQYFEWAAIVDENGVPRFYITQIADAPIKTDINAKSILTQPCDEFFIKSHGGIVGAGIKDSDCIFLLNNGRGLKELEEFNKSHNGYFLVFNTNMFGIMNPDPLDFHHYSNAGALVGLLRSTEFNHTRSLASHMKGAVDVSGMILATAEDEIIIRHRKSEINWKHLRDKSCSIKKGQYDEYEILQGNFRVVADSALQKMIMLAL